MYFGFGEHYKCWENQEIATWFGCAKYEKEVGQNSNHIVGSILLKSI